MSVACSPDIEGQANAKPNIVRDQLLTLQGVLFKGLSKRAVIAKFDQHHANTDGGSVLVKACDEKLKLSTTLVSCPSDDRPQSKVAHSFEALFQQRLFAVTCGCADGNHATRLADDPEMELLAGRGPIAGGSLAWQPTLSRLEIAAGQRHLTRLSEVVADPVIVRHKRRKKRVRRITIDLDQTDDPTHDAQQLASCNGFSDTSSYLPLAGFLTFHDELEHCLLGYVLRAGKFAAKHSAACVLKRLVPRLRRAFPGPRLRIRLDPGFSGPEL